MPLDISDHLLNGGTALVLHGKRCLMDSDLEQIPKLSITARAKIDSVVLSCTLLTDACLEHLSALPNLRKLYLQGTLITDNVPLELFARRLEVVNLDNTLVGDGAIRKLSLARNLRVLSAKNTHVSDCGAYRLVRATKLQEYHLSGTQVTELGRKRLDNATYRATFVSLARWFC